MIADERALRSALDVAFREALAELDPARLVASALAREPIEAPRVTIVAAGKAAAAMTKGALSVLGHRVTKAFVVTIEGAPGIEETFETSGTLEVRHTAHPLPDERSVAAAERALEYARGLGPRDVLLALVSGGASALLALPAPGLDLPTKRRVVRVLLEGGAPIQDVNLVRRHLSRIKGGRLALAASPARVRTLVISDVAGGALHDVGSGFAVPDPSTTEEAREAMQRHAPLLVAEGLDRHLQQTPPPESFPVHVDASFLAGPEDLGRTIATHLASLGFVPRVLPPEGGDVHAVIQRRIEQAASLAPAEALVIPCEPTLALPDVRGRGGRAGFVALAVMRSLPPGVALLCGASDGIDGSSATAGAVVSRAAADGVDPAWLDDALATFDDSAVHHALGTSIETGPTGQNLADVHVLARLQ